LKRFFTLDLVFIFGIFYSLNKVRIFKKVIEACQFRQTTLFQTAFYNALIYKSQ